jgi:hypothetical protein
MRRCFVGDLLFDLSWSLERESSPHTLADRRSVDVATARTDGRRLASFRCAAALASGQPGLAARCRLRRSSIGWSHPDDHSAAVGSAAFGPRDRSAGARRPLTGGAPAELVQNLRELSDKPIFQASAQVGIGPFDWTSMPRRTPRIGGGAGERARTAASLRCLLSAPAGKSLRSEREVASAERWPWPSGEPP